MTLEYDIANTLYQDDHFFFSNHTIYDTNLSLNDEYPYDPKFNDNGSNINTEQKISTTENDHSRKRSKKLFVVTVSNAKSKHKQSCRKLGRKMKRKLDDCDINDEPKNKKCHSRLSRDNIRKKVKASFMRFVITFFNKLIKKEWNGFQKKKFCTFNYQYTKNITIEYNYLLFQKTVRELFYINVSPKFKCQQNRNRIVCDFILERKPSVFDPLLNMTVSDFYLQLFCGEPNCIKDQYALSQKKDIIQKQKIIVFFKEYCQKQEDKNKQYDGIYNLKKNIDYFSLYQKEGSQLVDYYLNFKQRKNKGKTII